MNDYIYTTTFSICECNKCYHLESCEVLLPPDVFLVLWSHCRNHVVKVHDDVNKCVEQCKKCAVATCNNIKQDIMLSGYSATQTSIKIVF